MVDKAGLTVSVIGGLVFGCTTIVGFSFLLSGYEHSIPECGAGSPDTGYSPGPLSRSAAMRRAQIIRVNRDGYNQGLVTDYERAALRQTAVGVSRYQTGLPIAPVAGGGGGGSSSGMAPFPGQPLGAAGGSASNGYVGVGQGLPVVSVPSAAQKMSPCGPRLSAASPSLSTSGLPATGRKFSLPAMQVNTAPISAGMGTDAGVQALLQSPGGSPALGLYQTPSFSSQATSGGFQQIQGLLSQTAGQQGQGPVLGGINIGADQSPHGSSALASWQIGGLSIPASTQSALDVAADPAGGANPNSSTGVDYLASYASPDAGIAYLNQFSVSDSSVTYLGQISGMPSGQSSVGSSASPSGASSKGGGPATLSNTTPTDSDTGSTGSTNSSASAGLGTNLSASSATSSSGPSASGALNAPPSNSKNH